MAYRLARRLAVVGLVVGLSAVPGHGQGPADGVYTYRYGYNPGYYGCSTCPVDSGAKPGQAIVPNHMHYRLFCGGVPPKATGGVRPTGTR
jgi:hypothetical protein